MHDMEYPPGTPSWADLSSPDTDASADFYGELFGWQAEEGGRRPPISTASSSAGRRRKPAAATGSSPPTATRSRASDRRARVSRRTGPPMSRSRSEEHTS